jgi:pimeloyl-ACP methyl ester carboxylesterase
VARGFAATGPVPRRDRAQRAIPASWSDAVFYQLYFQAPGVAEAELERDVRFYIRGILFSNSGDGPLRQGGLSTGDVGMVPRDGGLRARMGAHMATPQALPPWITEADVDLYAAEFARTGFRGGLNWYRNIDRNWELLAAFAGAKVTVPALYLVGELDLTLAFRGAKELIANLAHFVPLLRQTIMLHGCGHWTQQERAEEVSATMIEFLRAL